MVWYSHLFKNFPQFVVIHTVKGFGIVNKAEVDVFLQFSFFFYGPSDVGSLIFGSSAFSMLSLIFSIIISSLYFINSCFDSYDFLYSAYFKVIFSCFLEVEDEDISSLLMRCFIP